MAWAAALRSSQGIQVVWLVSSLTDEQVVRADISGPWTRYPPELAVLHAWVELHIAPLVRPTTTTGEGGGVRWCRQWWEHVDAVSRFQALYLAFDELSQDESATWLSVYLRDHLDPHMATLTSPVGPFYACIPDHHSDTFKKLGQDPLAAPPMPVPVPTGGHR